MKSILPWQTLPGFRALREVGGFVFAMLASVAAANAADTGEGVTFFEKRIRPVLVEKCYKCHAADAEKIKGGLLLDTRKGIRQGGDSGPALVLGDPGKSLLMTAIATPIPTRRCHRKRSCPTR